MPVVRTEVRKSVVNSLANLILTLINSYKINEKQFKVRLLKENLYTYFVETLSRLIAAGSFDSGLAT